MDEFHSYLDSFVLANLTESNYIESLYAEVSTSFYLKSLKSRAHENNLVGIEEF